MSNDLEVSEQCAKVKRLARQLDELLANMPRTELKLAIALSDIQRAAEKAQWRLNDLKPIPPLVLPASRGSVSG